MALMLLLMSFVQGYGRDIISAVGAEVDRIEAEIQVMEGQGYPTLILITSVQHWQASGQPNAHKNRVVE
jgi:hypothetical protein